MSSLTGCERLKELVNVSNIGGGQVLLNDHELCITTNPARQGTPGEKKGISAHQQQEEEVVLEVAQLYVLMIMLF